MAGSSCHAKDADVRGGDVKAGDLVWIDTLYWSGPGLVKRSCRDAIDADTSPHFRLLGLRRKWARIIATADEIKQRNKERK